MVSASYKKYITSPRWKAKRLQVFAHYGRRCFFCRKRKKILQVHHRSYRHFGNEPLSDLVPACVDCHKRITAYHRRNRRAGIERNTAYMLKLIRAENPNS